MALTIQIILGTTRPGRVGERVARWVQTAAADRPDFDVELVDLLDYELPHFDEAVSPRYNPDRRPHPAVARWLDKVGQADGYIIVTPEYNHAIPGILKDALDFLDFQFAKKPVAVVSYGTVGGARAAEQLKQILIEVKAAVVPEAVALAGPRQAVTVDGHLQPDAGADHQAQILSQVMAELAWWAGALKAARDERLVRA